MNKKKLIIIFFIASAFCIKTGSLAEPIINKKTTVNSQNKQVKTIRCNNCPCNCLIKPNQAGDCGQYKNVNGKLVSVKK